MEFLIRSWYTQNGLTFFLKPFSFFYQFIVAIRRFFYKTGIVKITRFNVPIIIVGNITVGGTGKTPLVIWLANFLKQNGYQPGIVSRGYGGKANGYPQYVETISDPKIVGDEAVLIVRQTQCPMVVGPNRVAAVKQLLNVAQCDIVISDDGLQHYALGRDIEIAVIDAERRLGNGLCLPAGPLREPAKRLAEVDFRVANGEPQPNEYGMRLIPGELCQLINPEISCSLAEFKNCVVHAVAGIGNPTRFFDLLCELGFSIIEHPFPDHYNFKHSDLDFDQDRLIIMTEKDAVKCEQFADERFWYLPVKADMDPNLGYLILSRLNFSKNFD